MGEEGIKKTKVQQGLLSVELFECEDGKYIIREVWDRLVSFETFMALRAAMGSPSQVLDFLDDETPMVVDHMRRLESYLKDD